MYYVPKSVRHILSQAESYNRYFSNSHKNKFFFNTFRGLAHTYDRNVYKRNEYLCTHSDVIVVVKNTLNHSVDTW